MTKSVDRLLRKVDKRVERILSKIKKAQKAGAKIGVMRAASNTAGEIAKVLGPGALARSFRATPLEVGQDGTLSAWAASRGSARRYAGIQDAGGVIYPRNMKRLAVPVGTAKIAKGKWPRHFGKGELKLMPRPGRPPLLVKELMGKKVIARRSHGKIYKTWVKAVKPMYVLLPSVTIKAKHYLAEARHPALAAAPGIIDKAIMQAIRKRLSKKGGK